MIKIQDGTYVTPSEVEYVTIEQSESDRIAVRVNMKSQQWMRFGCASREDAVAMVERIAANITAATRPQEEFSEVPY